MRAAGSARKYRDEDFDVLLALLDATSGPDRSVTRTGLVWSLSAPGFDPASDLFVVPGPDGTGLLGARDVRVTARGDEEELILESWGAVHPAASRPQTAAALLGSALNRARTLLAERGRQKGILQARCGAGDAASCDAFAAAGLVYARDLVTMLRPSLNDVAAPRFPDGVAVRRYRSGDEAAWVAAFNAAFAGHWGGFMGMSAARWAHERTEAAFDPEISLVAWAGNQIAGFCHCRIDRELNDLRERSFGMIRYVGVAPAWRRQGLGAALTLAGLRTLRDAGMESVVLGVDAENVTGARRLYERYGFEVVDEQVMYRTAMAAADDAVGRVIPKRGSRLCANEQRVDR
jgi:mycothiol synthase